MILLLAPTDSNMLQPDDLWITICITLFILSLISERLANLIKLTFQNLYEEDEVVSKTVIKEDSKPEDRRASKNKTYLQKLLTSFRTQSRLTITSVQETDKHYITTQTSKQQRSKRAGRVFGNLRYPQVNKAKEKQRERGIQLVALICGILVSIFSGADIFHLILSGQLLGWEHWWTKHDFWDFFSGDKPVWTMKNYTHLLGMVLAGFFVSLGSKFWHDILDFVLYSSNLKRKLADPRTFSVGRVEELDEWLTLTKGQLGSKAYDKWSAALGAQENVAYVSANYQFYNGMFQDVLRVYLVGDDVGKIPTSVPITLESGRQIDVPVVIIKGVGGIPEAHVGTLTHSGINVVGSSLSGTLCCLLKPDDAKEATLFLTCNHVLTGGQLKVFSEQQLNSGSIEVEIQQEGTVVKGTLWDSIQDNFYDVALIKPDNQFDLDAFSNDTFRVTADARQIIAQDVNQLSVRVLRGTRSAKQPTRGFLTAYHRKTPIPIRYKGQDTTLTGLLEFRTSDQEDAMAVSVGGDSGSLVYDLQNRPIGMIIAGNRRCSYAIPLTDILTKTNTKIFTF